MQECCCQKSPTVVACSPVRRLVYIAGDNEQMRLIENPPLDVKYCALSYCWGGAEGNMKTTRANHSDHLQSLDRSLLPKVWCTTLIRFR